MSINGHKTSYTRTMYLKKRKEKIHSILTTSLKITSLPLTKMSYTNSHPKNDYSHIQNYFPFLSRMTKGKSVK